MRLEMWSKIKEYLLNLLGLGFVTLIFTMHEILYQHYRCN
jgi:hypothetical protein